MAKRNIKRNKKNKNAKQQQQQPRYKQPRQPEQPFRSVGGTVGSIFGPLGKTIGAALGSGIGSIFGSGDYYMPLGTPEHNSIINTRQPSFGGNVSSAHKCILKRREYIGDVVTPTTSAFTLTRYTINPGDPTTFPFLSALAQCFEQYRFRGLVFEYRSMSSDSLSATNSGLGTVSLATQYDSLDGAFASKLQIENYDLSQSAKPSVNQLHGVECKSSENTLTNLYINPGGVVPAGADARFYNTGIFSVAVSGGQQSAASTWGELYVDYEIELLKPKLPESIGGRVASAHVTQSGCTGAVPVGTASVQNTGTLPLTFASGSTITYAGAIVGAEYLIVAYWKADIAAAATPPTLSVTGMTAATLWWNNNDANSGAPLLPAVASDTRTCYRALRATATATTGTFTFSTAATLPSTNCYLDFYVTQLDVSVN